MSDKSYDELEFTDDFMFWNILVSRPDLCKGLLELILGVKISKISFPEGQKAIELKYDARGIRLDVYLDDEDGTVYDLEMQTDLKKSLPKRVRYYQGMIDLNLIRRGALFSELKKSYIIFLCTADPFKRGLPVYTFENICNEDRTLKLNDDSYKVFINPISNREGLSGEMNSFLDFLNGAKDVTGLSRELSDAVDEAKMHRRWEVEYMTLQMKIQEEREEARAEGRIEGISKGRINEIFHSVSEGDYGVARGAEKLGISQEEFISQMTEEGFKIP